MTIPKIIFQTSKNKRPLPYIIKMIKNKAPEWDYIHFTDLEIINFFINNPIEEFPDIIKKFKSIKCGAHKADLFRYYFLYIKGGVFIDDDAMLQYDMNYISSDYDFFSVNSSYCPGCIFQGLIGAVPQNKIIYEALKDAYNINIKKLNKDYLLICRNLYNIIKNNSWDFRYKIYDETYGSDKVAIMIDKEKNNLIILAHYFNNKIVPNEYFNLKHL
jgi:hypothetical protein